MVFSAHSLANFSEQSPQMYLPMKKQSPNSKVPSLQFPHTILFITSSDWVKVSILSPIYNDYQYYLSMIIVITMYQEEIQITSRTILFFAWIKRAD